MCLLTHIACIRRADAFHPDADSVIPAMTLVAVNPIKTTNRYFTEIFRSHFREFPVVTSALMRMPALLRVQPFRTYFWLFQQQLSRQYTINFA